ncbi:MAG TPA: AAA family ATPase, partial [Jatrophihabitans sp.]|nr:AAA family ATPase [Jatrophihabitans sp.]
MFAAFCAAGLWPGLGSTLTAELAEAGIRGPDDVTASALATLPRVGPVRAGRLVSAFIAAGPAYQVTELLVAAELPARWAARVIELFGAAGHRLLRDDPWRLLQVTGVDVPDADALARAAIANVERDDPRRSRALVGFTLARLARDGHTVWPAAEVAQDLQLYRVPDPDAAIADALTSGQVHSVDGEALALDRYFTAEQQIAESLHRLTRTAEPIGPTSAKRSRQASGDTGLDQTQASAVANALAHGVSVLTGGPGTGKSRTVAAVVHAAERAGKSVALAAPTGRAAKRLAELCDAEAMTIHRLLGAQPRSTGEGGILDFSAGFSRGADWPLDEDLVVVDEASMLDVELAAALLTACADGTHLM